MTQDTIAAIATAKGRAALAIVRLSGSGAVDIACQCFGEATLRAAASHTAHVGVWRTPDGVEIDQVVVTIFRAPRSATGEDVIEISCHGGEYVAALVLESLLHSGARLAAPGEFTQRAFLHGKMDLAQAEAVADLIHASSSLAHRVSVAQVHGRYSELLEDLRNTLLEVCALAELEIDFAEEGVAFADRDQVRTLLERTEDLLSASLCSYPLGVLVREGVRAVIAGRPNAGKSTLLNALVGRDRVIVSSIPGTTRDTVEADTEIEGILFRFIDTAGLRDTSEHVEAEGVQRARRVVEEADTLIYVYDMSIGLQAAEQLYLREAKKTLPTLVVGNKMDLVEEAEGGTLCLSAQRARQEPRELDGLLQALVALVARGLQDADVSRVVTNQRHCQHMRAALEAVQAARKAVDAGHSGDMFTLDIRAALHEIGAITGAVTNEDVLGEIFSRFCIGK